MRSIEKIQKDFLDDLDKWQKIINEHKLGELQKQTEPTQWSIGQVIHHFTIETDWYIEQARKALIDTQNFQKLKSPIITEWFAANSFPDERFKGPEDMQEPHQPISANALIEKLEGLKKEISKLTDEILVANSKGKAEHPGHHYLTAQEWLQYAEMHCRHHFRQYERIAQFLK